MTVQQDLANLQKLQELDLKTIDIRNELDDIPNQIEDVRKNVETIRMILQKEQVRLEEAEGWKTDKEKEITLQNDLLVKSKTKLQGARNDKENKAAQREIDTIKKNISDQEKELIELMEAIEQYRIAIDEHKKEFAELEEHLKASEQEGEARMAEIKATLSEADSGRKELTVHISQQTLRLYERVQRKLGQAIVPVTEPICSGCNFGMLPQKFIELQRGESLITCPQCLRILVYTGEPIVEEPLSDDE
ncbi:MAG: hypothetical protein JXX29_17070 [Deltaproteobacteria bacterium]|nr:hypothetical protein [Deltaproteobacteria bacterium]MBN2673399.1 hypothetical protein [Deltaproteobacteria bacterium]